MIKNKRADLILIGGIIVIIAAMWIIINVFIKKSDDSNNAVVKIDGQTVYTLSLNKDTSITVDGYNGGKNTITIKDGTAYMQEADCPDHLCVKSGSISKTGETVVCLPHRVVIEIKGSKDSGVDNVVR